MRWFTEADVFSGAFDSARTNRILLRECNSLRKDCRAPPAYIDNPFSENFARGLSQPHVLSRVDDFCIAVPDAVLYGERAVVTRDDFLIGDARAQPPAKPVFPAMARDVEFMHSERDSFAEYLTSEKVDRPDVHIGGDAFLLSSWEHANYGAMLLRQIPKLMFWKALGLTHLPVVCPGAKWQLELLKMFGVDRVIQHDRRRSYQFDTLLVASRRENSLFFDADVAAFFNDIAVAVCDRTPPLDTKLLYVSRRSQGRKRPNYRRCLNEDDLIEALLKRGFAIFEPESHSVERQVAAFRGADFVVGPAGAAMFNTVFCRRGTHVLSIEPVPNFAWQHSNLFGSMGHVYGFVTGGALADDPAPVQKSWRADIAAITARVDKVLRDDLHADAMTRPDTYGA